MVKCADRSRVDVLLMVCCRSRLEMLNISENGLEGISGLASLGSLMSVNLGECGICDGETVFNACDRS